MSWEEESEKRRSWKEGEIKRDKDYECVLARQKTERHK